MTKRMTQQSRAIVLPALARRIKAKAPTVAVAFAAGNNSGQRKPGLLYIVNASIDVLHDIVMPRIEDHACNSPAVRNLNTIAAPALAQIHQEIKSRLWQEPLVYPGA